MRPIPQLLVLMLVLTAAPGNAQDRFCDAEREQANALALRIENEWPTRSKIDPVSRYLQHLADTLAAASPAAASLPWQITLVRDRAVNAFSIGAGRIYITEGAVRLCRNESELAAVLAHEMGHELAGHFCRQQTNFWHAMLNSFRPASGNAEGEQSRSRVGSLAQEVDPAKEREADRIAINIMSAGGHNPHALLDLVQRLPAGTSHLQDPQRIQALELLLAEIPGGLPRSSPQFSEARRMLE